MSVPDPRLRELARRAYAGLVVRVTELGPHVGPQLLAWMRSLRPEGEPSDYLLDVRAFPTLHLPWFAALAASAEADEAFLEELLLGCFAGYYQIRLIDDVMDEPDGPRALLPATVVLQRIFLGPYQQRFPSAHPIHGVIERTLRLSAEVTVHDATVASIDRETFYESSGRKTCAVHIPIAAALHVHGGSPLVPAWIGLADALGRWHQLENDCFDWARDHAAGRVTWLLSEAARRAPAMDPGAWVLARGLPWVFDELDRGWGDILGQARELDSPELEAWLSARQQAHRQRREDVFGPLVALRARFATIIDGGADD